MAAPKELKSTSRYLIARLKPFGRFIFWGPIGITLVIGLVLWQYLSHPEWRQQPLETDNPTGTNLDSVDVKTTNPQATETNQIPLTDPLKPQASPTTPSLNTGKLGSNLQPNFFNKFTQTQPSQPQEGTTKTPTTQLFKPLFPPRQVSSPPSAPVNTINKNNLPDSQVTAEENNPLQKALDRQFANPSQTANTTQIPPSINRNNQPNVSQSQFNNYQLQSPPTQPYQAPYNPYNGQGAQPQPQSYNNPYNGQVPSQSSQNPYNNPYGGQNNAGYPNQVAPNSNPYGAVTPQIQPSLEGSRY